MNTETYEIIYTAVTQALDAVFDVIQGDAPIIAAKKIFLGDMDNYCCDRSSGFASANGCHVSACYEHIRLANRLEVLQRAFKA